MIRSIARAVAATAAVAALGIGLAGTASAAAGEPRGHGHFGGPTQGCVNTGLTLLGCTQVVDVLNDVDLDVLSELVEVEDVVAQVPVIDSEAIQFDGE